MANRYEKMSDDELRELAKQRAKDTGCFKNTALAAQRELWKRTHWDTCDDIEVATAGYDRSIEDIQYNG